MNRINPGCEPVYQTAAPVSLVLMVHPGISSRQFLQRVEFRTRPPLPGT